MKRRKIPECVGIVHETLIKDIMSSKDKFEEHFATMLETVQDDDLIAYEKEFRLSLLFLKNVQNNKYSTLNKTLNTYISAAKLRTTGQTRMDSYFMDSKTTMN